MKLFIVVPTFERFEHINKLIKTLDQQIFNNYVLIVVDHGITKVNKINNSKIIYLNASPDLWWTGAINFGIRFVLDNFNNNDNVPILIINDDVIIAKKNYLSSLMDYWLQNKTSLIGSLCASETGRVIYCSMIYNFMKAKLIYHYKGSNIDDLKSDFYDSDVLKGRGTLIPSSVFRKIGLFNEEYLPHYKADHEFTFRASKNGFSLVVLKMALLYSDLNSPHEFDVKNKFHSIWNILFGVRSVNNLKDLFFYSFICFSPIYAFYYFMLNSSRILLINLKKLFSKC